MRGGDARRGLCRVRRLRAAARGDLDVAGIPVGWILRRSLIETPFVVLAILLPIAGADPRVEWLGMSLSEPGATARGIGALFVRSYERGLQEIRRRVGVVFQDPDDQLFMPTVAEDVAFGPANFGISGDALTARVDTALGTVGMAEHRDRSPLHLSGGPRRRVALATVLACDPEILVLDEPSANLDPVARRELAEVLLGLDATMLMATHDLPYALQLCPRSVVIDDGVVVADGATRELLRDPELLRSHRLELPYGFTLS